MKAGAWWWVLLLALLCALAGCASSARQSVEFPPAPLSAPARADGTAAASPGRPAAPAPTPQIAQQSGQGNVSAQLDASGWKGVEYTTAVPVGQVVLLALMLLLSHRREVLRIRQNGRHATDATRRSS